VRSHRELDDKIKIMIDAQIRYDAQLAQARLNLDEKLAQTHLELDGKLTQSRLELDEKLTQSRLELDENLTQSRLEFDGKLANVLDAQARADERIATLAVSQERTGRRLDALIDLVRQQRNSEGLS